MTLPMSQPQTVTTESLPPEWQNLATKADLAEVHGEVADLRSDVVELRTRMEFMATKEDLAELRAQLASTATKEDLAELRGEFVGLRASLRTAGWFIGLVIAVVQIGMFFLQRSLG